MARLQYDGLGTTLSGSHSDSVTTLTLDSAFTASGGTDIDTIAGPDYMPLSLLNSDGELTEIVWVTAYTSGATTCTVSRGQEDTPAVAHADGDVAVNAPTVMDFGGGGGSVVYANQIANVDDPAVWGTPSDWDLEFDEDASSVPSGATQMGSTTGSTYSQYGGAAILHHPGGPGSVDLRGILYPGPTSSDDLGAGAGVWTVTGKLTGVSSDGNYWESGLWLGDSAANKQVLISFRYGGALTVQYCASGTVSSTLTTINNSSQHPPAYVRFTRHSSTSYDCEVSEDGIAWFPVLMNTDLHTYLATVDRIGFATWRYDGTPGVVACHWIRVRGTTQGMQERSQNPIGISGTDAVHVDNTDPLNPVVTSVPDGVVDDFSTDWSWVNQGSVSLSVVDHAATLVAPSGGSFSWALRVIAAGGGDATITAKLRYTCLPAQYAFFGPVLRNSSSGKFISWGYGTSGTVDTCWGYSWNNATTINTDVISIFQMQGAPIAYFRLRVASGTINFEVSPDGVNWISFGTQAVSTFLSSYDQIGFGIHNSTGKTAIGMVEWLAIEA